MYRKVREPTTDNSVPLTLCFACGVTPQLFARPVSVTGAKKAPYFCYICKNVQLGLLQCYVFKYAGKIPFILAQAVGEAFKLNERLPNPFAPLAKQDLITPPKALERAEIRRQFLRSTAVVRGAKSQIAIFGTVLSNHCIALPK